MTGPSGGEQDAAASGNETGIVDRFSGERLAVTWRAPVGSGYAGPAVSAGRVFVTDFRPSRGLEGHEGLVALDQLTGMPLWSRRWPVDYAGIEYAAGPRATPTVDGNPRIRIGRDRPPSLRAGA